MSGRRLAALAALALLVLAANAHGQTTRTTRSSAHAWLDLTGDLWLTPRLGIQAESKVERSRFAAAPQLYELRAGLERPWGGAIVAAGGMLVHSSPYGPFPAASATNEYRVWEQATLDQHVGRVALSHRYRFEERWIERPHATSDGPATGRSFRLRMRYQARGTFPLGGSAAQRAPYLVGFDEVFVSLGPHTALNLLDQNRAALGIGMRWSAAVRTEANYVDQVILRADGRQVENNHTLQLAMNVTRGTPRR